MIGTSSSWLVMAFDVLANQEVTDFVTERLGRAMEPEDICEELMNRWVVVE